MKHNGSWLKSVFALTKTPFSLLSLLVSSGLGSRFAPFESVVATLGASTMVVVATASPLASVKSASLVIKVATLVVASATPRVVVGTGRSSQGFLEVLVIQVHSLLHVKNSLHRGLQTGYDGGVGGRTMPQTDCVRTILRR